MAEAISVSYFVSYLFFITLLLFVLSKIKIHPNYILELLWVSFKKELLWLNLSGPPW